MLPNGDTREHILDSAAAVVLREGANNLTLEKVAREAGISKGGLLYHFNVKERLISALLERVIAHFERDLVTHEQQDSDHIPGRRTRAFVRATLEGTWDRTNGGVGAALLAAASTDPELLTPLRRSYAGWQAGLENDDIAPARATVVRLAADGLWFAEVLGLVRLAPARRRDIIREMLNLAQPALERRAAKPRARRATA